MNKFKQLEESDLRYLRVLARSYPTIASCATEIVNLNAILHLPKGTEHFITDLHGEYDQFLHILKNGSGAIRRKIDDEFGRTGRMSEKKEMAALIYYPREKLAQIKKTETHMAEWYRITIYRLISICKMAESKYTRSKVRKAIPEEFGYIIEELLTGQPEEADQEAYFNEIIDSVIKIKWAEELIVVLCDLIRRLIVDHLHVIGDIFDRGPYPHKIMDTLMDYHSVDIQWGNHDIEWMGAAAGNAALMANVIRNSVRYGNLDVLEDGYGINLIPLARFAMETYGDVDCNAFSIHYAGAAHGDRDRQLEEQMHKAITVIQFKLEGSLIRRHPEWKMDDRILLERVDPATGMVEIEGRQYAMKDMELPTVDWKDPLRLTDEEAEVVDRLLLAFANSEKLQRHVGFLFKKGNLYKVYNGNLLYHGCVPLNADGSFKEIEIDGETYCGRRLYDCLEEYVRKGYYAVDEHEKEKGIDTLFYLWEHPDSPVFGKQKMTTFERYFVEDKSTHSEPKNPYYALLDREDVVCNILREFGLDPDSDAHIVNGHVPVEVKAGESPIKCDGRLLIIDGGFSRAYHDKTGIAGYTLIFHSYGMQLAAHEPFESVEKAVKEGSDIHSHTEIVQRLNRRMMVADTDAGKQLAEMVDDLGKLLAAYRDGELVEGS